MKNPLGKHVILRVAIRMRQVDPSCPAEAGYPRLFGPARPPVVDGPDEAYGIQANLSDTVIPGVRRARKPKVFGREPCGSGSMNTAGAKPVEACVHGFRTPRFANQIKDLGQTGFRNDAVCVSRRPARSVTNSLRKPDSNDVCVSGERRRKFSAGGGGALRRPCRAGRGPSGRAWRARGHVSRWRSGSRRCFCICPSYSEGWHPS